MYKIYIVIAFFSVQLLVAQENTKDKSIASEVQSNKIQQDTSALKIVNANKFSLSNKVEETARPRVNSANVKENIYRRLPNTEKRDPSETELKKRRDTIH